MRSIRNAAVASATAITLMFGATSVVAAQDTEACSTPTDNVQSCVPVEDAGEYPTENNPDAPSGSTQLGRYLDREEGTTGTALFGEDSDLSSQPDWAQAFYGLSIIAGLGSLVGLVVGPIYNAIVHGLQF